MLINATGETGVNGKKSVSRALHEEKGKITLSDPTLLRKFFLDLMLRYIPRGSCDRKEIDS